MAITFGTGSSGAFFLSSSVSIGELTYSPAAAVSYDQNQIYYALPSFYRNLMSNR